MWKAGWYAEERDTVAKNVICLWYDGGAEEASTGRLQEPSAFWAATR